MESRLDESLVHDPTLSHFPLHAVEERERKWDRNQTEAIICQSRDPSIVPNMAAANPVVLGPGDLPTREDIEDKVDKELEAMEEQLHNAEVFRRAAVIMADELRWREASGTGVMVRNEPRVRGNPRLYMRDPPTLGVAYVSLRPVLLTRGLSTTRWLWDEPSLTREVNRLPQMVLFRDMMPVGLRTGPAPVICRIPGGSLNAAVKLYNSVRGKMNYAAATADKRRYVIQFLRERDGLTQFAELRRPINSKLPDPTARASTPGAIRRCAVQEYKKYVRERFNAYAIPSTVPVPPVGVPRDP